MYDGVPKVHQVDLNKRRNRYPFADMEVGDTFIYSLSTDRQHQKNASSAANSYVRSQAPEKKFSTLSTEEGMLVTRIK